MTFPHPLAASLLLLSPFPHPRPFFDFRVLTTPTLSSFFLHPPRTASLKMVPYGVESPLILGVLEIGVFVSVFLFGIVALQGYIYWRSAAEDRLWLRIFVGTLLILELAHTISACHAVYFFTILEAGVPELERVANSYSLAVTPVFETAITAMVQGFFTYRIYLLSGRKLIPGICASLGLARLVGGLAMAVEGVNDVPLQPNGFHYQNTYGWVITTALDIGVVLDVLITLSLCFYMRKLYDPYNLPGGEVLLDRMILWTIETGLITSLTSVTVVIAFTTMKYNYVWLALYTLLAKCNLNSRPSNRRIVRNGRGSPEPTTGVKTWSRWDATPSPSRPVSPRSSLTIHITRTRTTDADFDTEKTFIEKGLLSAPNSRPASPPCLQPGNASAGPQHEVDNALLTVPVDPERLAARVRSLGLSVVGNHRSLRDDYAIRFSPPDSHVVMALQPTLRALLIAGTPDAPHTLDVFLDYVCPFSAKMARAIDSILGPLLGPGGVYYGKVKVVFRPQVQPWHVSSTLVHEAGLAVARAAPASFWPFSLALFARQGEYFDAPTEKLTRADIRAKLAALVAEVDQSAADGVTQLLTLKTTSPNGGNGVTDDLKYTIKFARQNGIHVSPTVLWDGLVANEISSGWGETEWEGFLAAKVVL
ncbi:hypothetical protein MIND_01281800 [Mycena indigotica]|uniref:DUF6534 domain-containing protein n=1 Tax=Mycena indigotica TaxID=2126181 RepID=A0A8H6S2B0_9AGAR|nr:uncharacterized protein MIND_01281800 [Mycena indigotica]KAF7291373.1 hypothetical protein MIND_01281800 [Mycena indigotica]